MRFGILSYIYWFAGFGMVMNGLMTMDPANTFMGIGLFVLAMVMVAALIFDPFTDD
jgi:hypothetical protein|tara:strand:- start:382 stop:549 length:168 start_codon:yes stop_codon:yes gene_type:complete